MYNYECLRMNDAKKGSIRNLFHAQWMGYLFKDGGSLKANLLLRAF